MPDTEVKDVLSRYPRLLGTCPTCGRSDDKPPCTCYYGLQRDEVGNLRAKLSFALEAQQKAERCTRCAGDPPEFEDKDCECGGSKKITEQISGLRGCIQWWRYRHKITTGERDEARATIERLEAEKREMREALKSLRSEQISPDEWGIKCIADHNAIIDAALAGSPAAEGTKETRNSEALASFTEYCRLNPSQRFWQALRNWSRWGYILGAQTRNGGTIDTFNLEGLDGTRTASPAAAGEAKEGEWNHNT